MDYKEIHELSGKLTAKELLQLMMDFINKGGDTKLSVHMEKEKTLEDWHPTLQQCLMRGFIRPAIIALSKDPMPDERNRATVKICKEILPIFEKYTLPFM